jgi:hypothetical protein
MDMGRTADGLRVDGGVCGCLVFGVDAVWVWVGVGTVCGSLGANGIGPEGASAIADALHHVSSLTKLRYAVGDEAMRVVCGAMELCVVRQWPSCSGAWVCACAGCIMQWERRCGYAPFSVRVRGWGG